MKWSGQNIPGFLVVNFRHSWTFCSRWKVCICYWLHQSGTRLARGCCSAILGYQLMFQVIFFAWTMQAHFLFLFMLLTFSYLYTFLLLLYQNHLLSLYCMYDYWQSRFDRLDHWSRWVEILVENVVFDKFRYQWSWTSRLWIPPQCIIH